MISFVLRDTPEPVYNIEVEMDHCYRVGESGVLVHNDSAKGSDCCKKMKFKHTKKPPTGETWMDYVLSTCRGDKKGIENPHGHHIVMKGDRFPENNQARQILCRYGINPFEGCENLVVSPNKCHSASYAQRVLQELKKADAEGTKSAIIQALKDLAKIHRDCPEGGMVDLAEDEDPI